MKRISKIGSLLKRIYRLYSQEVIRQLEERGFHDLRPSFIEILVALCENPGVRIKVLGEACGLKKQTMTSHLNELEKRGYIARTAGSIDRREQNISLTDLGERFKYHLFEITDEIEKNFSQVMGSIEMERMEFVLENFHSKMPSKPLSLDA